MSESTDRILIDLLKTQLGLTEYETLAFVSIIYGKGQPGTVAEASGIPRPKVYGALESLEKQEFIVKTTEGTYEPNMAKLSAIREDTAKITKKYAEFIETLHSYSMAPNRVLSNAKKEIITLLNRLEYSLENDETIIEKIDKSSARHAIMRYQHMFGVFLRESTRERYRILDNYINKSIDYNVKSPDIIARSPTSAMRIGIVLDSQKESIIPRLPALYAAFDLAGCNMGIVITMQSVDSKQAEWFREFSHRIDDEMNFRVISIQAGYVSEIEQILQETDFKWIELKRKLADLEDLLNNAKVESRRLMYKVESIRKDKELYPIEYRSIFADILARIRNDLETIEQLLSQLDDVISRRYGLLDRKVLFSISDLTEIEKRIKYAENNLMEKNKELQNFEEELYSIPSQKNPYIRYGLKLNPFSLSVPLEKPTTIVNQKNATASAHEFLSSVVHGSDDNLMLIIGSQGAGKSHFLHYYANQINTGKFGKALAIKIQCKNNRDIVDLYPQITEGLKYVLQEKNETQLIEIISNILAEAGTPRLVQDLMKILKEIELKLVAEGYNGIFILIDEFENSLPTLHDQSEYLGYSARRTVTPQAISQLDSLTKLSGTGFIIAFRKEDWEVWKGGMKRQVGKIAKKYLVNMEPLTVEDSKIFLSHRLEADEFRSSAIPIEKPKFADEAVKVICEKGRGNPRQMLRYASAAFRKAIKSDNNTILASLID